MTVYLQKQLLNAAAANKESGSCLTKIIHG